MPLRRSISVVLLALVPGVVACREELSAPVQCPALCPGGFQIVDTVLVPLADQDSSYEGYVQAGQGSSLRVSYQFPVSEDRAVIRFVRRADSFPVGDSLKPYVIDSVSLAISLQFRDTVVKNLFVYLYRLPATLDSSFTFLDADTAFTPANIVDSFSVADSVQSQRLQHIYSGAELAKVAIPAADSGVLAIGVQIRAPQGTGVRIGGQSSGSEAPNFTSFVTVQATDTTTIARTLSRGVAFGRFLSQSLPTLDPSLLTIGGAPSARSLIRFDWSRYLRDSVEILRATLELVPTTAVPGLNGDSAFVTGMPILADFGEKSPTVGDGTFFAFSPVLAGSTDTVRLELQRAVRLWQGANAVPPAFMLRLSPEASSFTRPTFGSTRTPALTPRLRLTFARDFPFEDM